MSELRVSGKAEKESKASQEILLECEESRSLVSLKGGCVRSFSVRKKEILFPDQEIEIKGRRKRRGGIPLLFPWAGPLEEMPRLPQHGFARDLVWESLSVPHEFKDKRALLELGANLDTMGIYSYPFSLYLQVEVGENGLNHLLTVSGGSFHTPMPIAPGLHPYFNIPSKRISDIETNIAGFNPAEYELGKPLDFLLQEVELEIPDVGLIKITPGDAFEREQARLIVWSDSEEYICIEPWSAPLGGFLNPDEQIMVGDKVVRFSTKISLL